MANEAGVKNGTERKLSDHETEKTQIAGKVECGTTDATDQQIIPAEQAGAQQQRRKQRADGAQPRSLPPLTRPVAEVQWRTQLRALTQPLERRVMFCGSRYSPTVAELQRASRGVQQPERRAARRVQSQRARRARAADVHACRRARALEPAEARVEQRVVPLGHARPRPLARVARSSARATVEP